MAFNKIAMVPCGRPERQEAEEGSTDLQLQATRERLAHHLCGVVMIIRTLVKQSRCSPILAANKDEYINLLSLKCKWT